MRKQAGFSLFEIMLTLVVASMIAVGAAKVASSKAQSAADKVYGQNLFAYSQAAYLCAKNHQGTTAGLVGSGTFQTGTATATIATDFWTAYGPAAQQNLNTLFTNSTQYNMGYQYNGTAWLSTCKDPTTNVTYLPNNFNLASNMDRLLILLSTPAKPTTTPATAPGASVVSPAASIQGNNALNTFILYSTTTPSLPPLVFVISGALYQPDPKVANQYDLQPGLTGDATNVANTMLSSIGTSSPYKFTYLRNTLGVGAPVFGYPSTSATSSSSAPGGSYLQTVGYPTGNKMLGTLSINPPGGGGTLNFATGMGKICGLHMFNMTPDASNNPPTINFTSNSQGTLGWTGVSHMGMSPIPTAGITKLNSIVLGTNNPNTYTGPNPTIDLGSQASISPLALTPGQSQIVNLTYLAFDGTSSAQIIGLRTLTMYNPGGSPNVPPVINMSGGYIKNLPKGDFHGIQVSPPGTYQAVGPNAKVTGPQVYSSTAPTQLISWCTLSDIYTENDSGTPGACQVNNVANYWVVQAPNTSNPSPICGMTCIQW